MQGWDYETCRLEMAICFQQAKETPYETPKQMLGASACFRCNFTKIGWCCCNSYIQKAQMYLRIEEADTNQRLLMKSVPGAKRIKSTFFKHRWQGGHIQKLDGYKQPE